MTVSSIEYNIYLYLEYIYVFVCSECSVSDIYDESQLNIIYEDTLK